MKLTWVQTRVVDIKGKGVPVPPFTKDNLLDPLYDKGRSSHLLTGCPRFFEIPFETYFKPI